MVFRSERITSRLLRRSSSDNTNEADFHDALETQHSPELESSISRSLFNEEEETSSKSRPWSTTVVVNGESFYNIERPHIPSQYSTIHAFIHDIHEQSPSSDIQPLQRRPLSFSHRSPQGQRPLQPAKRYPYQSQWIDEAMPAPRAEAQVTEVREEEARRKRRGRIYEPREITPISEVEAARIQAKRQEAYDRLTGEDLARGRRAEAARQLDEENMLRARRRVLQNLNAGHKPEAGYPKVFVTNLEREEERQDERSRAPKRGFWERLLCF